jgi:flagellar biosynthesis protein FlhF
MRLKSFYAKTVTEAMQMIRDTLGEDAIIVATREEGGGKTVRVTAAIEQDRMSDSFDEFDRDEVRAFSESGWLQYDEESDVEVAEALTEIMLKHSVPEEIIDQIVSCATVAGLEQPHIALIAALEHLYAFRPLPQKPVDKALMMVGPPGAGKTLAIAKLAARSAMKGLKTAVISTDTLRAGGVEQLAAFTRILDIPLQKARDAKELRRAIDLSRGADVTLIDCGGFNPFRSDEMRDLARLMSAGDIEPVLAMPAGADADESGEMARIYSALGVRNMMPTRLDIARRLGGLLSAAHHGGLIFADASDTPQVADGLQPLSPQHLAQLLMPHASHAGEQGRDKKESSMKKRIVNAG